MQNPCLDNYSTTFDTFHAMRMYQEKLSLESKWHRCKVDRLHVEPLDRKPPLYAAPAAFASGISPDAVEDNQTKADCFLFGQSVLYLTKLTMQGA